MNTFCIMLGIKAKPLFYTILEECGKDYPGNHEYSIYTPTKFKECVVSLVWIINISKFEFRNINFS